MMKTLEAPAALLINPKFPYNVGAAVRACACFGIPTLLWTGERMQVDGRLPREERMKGYRSVHFEREERPFSRLPHVVPVGVELHPTAMPITDFEHPEKAVYVFGPEDGSIPQAIRRHCHYFVFVPTHHCLNLSAAVNVVLFDRRVKRQRDGLEPYLRMDEVLHERRGVDTPAMAGMGWDGK